MAGVLILTASENAVVLLNVSSAAQLMIVGALMVGAVALQHFKWRRYGKWRPYGASRGGTGARAVSAREAGADAN